MKKITLLSAVAMLWPKIRHKTIPILFLFLFFCTHLFAQQHTIQGIVSNSQGVALQGATVKIKGATSIQTDAMGNFNLKTTLTQGFLIISFIGYKSKALAFEGNQLLKIILENNTSDLQEVEVVSTGYQNIPKERATGSFTLIDQKTLERSVSADIISRLKGVTNGLLIDRPGGGNFTGLNVRGRSTILSDPQPLIVIDNFPFEGDINTINPNDVENVTLLKDAAAASIWGTRAGNGVIVITTKRGKLNQNTRIQFNTNLTLGQKPNLYYKGQLSSAEYIDVEKFLFSKGAYTAMLNLKYYNVSPVVEILQKIKENPAYASEGNAAIDALANNDIRKQQEEYFLRTSSRQQYHININGGGATQSYFFSAGYDKNLPTRQGSMDDRISLKANNSYKLLKDKLVLSTDLNFSKSTLSSTIDYSPFLPYEQIADDEGNALAVLKSGALRSAYTDTAGNGRLLDWKYRPLEELNSKASSVNSSLTDYRLLLGLSYKIFKPLSVSLNYQYFNSNKKIDDLDKVNSFSSRDFINRFSQINTLTGEVTRPVPLGDIYSASFTNSQAQYGRGQLNYSQTFGSKHEINAIAGYEIRDDQAKSNTYQVYGYNPETGASTPVDVMKSFKYYYSTVTSTIPNTPRQSGAIDRYRSFYMNGGYSYDGRYLFSGSYRKDESNLFGVEANQKGVPLWSLGLAWNLYKEQFFSWTWLSYLQLKGSYGYNGNVNKSVSAYLTAQPGGASPLYPANFNTIVNPPNDNLRWERVQNINLGLDFRSKNNWLSGSIEYYLKRGLDLIGTSPIAPQTGIVTFTGNTADTRTRGLDIQLNSLNINRLFKWNTIAIINYAQDMITDYKVKVGSNSTFLTGGSTGFTPLAGYPIRSMFGYKWNGLDAAGNPQGELDGSVSVDYTKIRNTTDIAQLSYFGSQTPTLFGSLRNQFAYKNLELSFNIIYKFHYYFRRPSINYQALFSAGSGYMQADYQQRWQKAGDELITNIPSAQYPVVANRNDFYTYSAILIEKGDHIRLQDIQLSYNLNKTQFKWMPFEQMSVYAYANNIGILWSANKQNLDPDAITYPTPRTFAFGLKTNF